MSKWFFTIVVVLSLHSAWGQSASVHCVNGNIVYADSSGISIKVTHLGRDRVPILHPNGAWIYFVRSYEGTFVDERYCPPPGQNVLPGLLKEELWRIKINGTGAKRLFQASNAPAPSPDPDYSIATIENIQFSPDGNRVYFETSDWATSAGLNCMNVNGTRHRRLGPGNDTHIILSAKKPEYRGSIVTLQHRYFVFGGSYDWYFLFTPDMKKEIGPVGEDIKDIVAIDGLLFMPRTQ